ncbi:T9SS type A sorting domain-containing protein, partial [Larkinella soli]|uniref:T9SS type A sorting domain-containing protein n=1 Tax=Larkinella soli TaxID=1770527 RepID=UPI0013E2D876
DVFLFNGQSNLNGYMESYSYRNPFIRSFGKPEMSVPDTNWHLSNVPEAPVGIIATELQRLILEAYDMPTCVINAAISGTMIRSHLHRNPANPADPLTVYGRLMYMAKKAGVVNQAKALVWRQGEAEASGGVFQTYDQDLTTMYSNWFADFPNLNKYYVAQINLVNDATSRAGFVREVQRRAARIFPKTESIATVGLPGYEGLHYGLTGHLQFARELFRLIARDFYGSADVSNISSPNLRKAYFRNAEKKEVVLEFEEGQTLVWKQDTVVTNPDGSQTTLDLRDHFFFNYADAPQARQVESATVQGNRIILTLKQAVDAQHITYVPNSFPVPFGGPFLKNQRGMRALTFYKFPIASSQDQTGPDGSPGPPPPPGNNSEPVNPANGAYKGYLDKVYCERVVGWVWDQNRPTAPVTIEVYVGSTPVTTAIANEPRPDLLRNGIGDGLHGYTAALPPWIRNGQPQSVSIRVKNSSYQIRSSPQTITCAPDPNAGIPPGNTGGNTTPPPTGTPANPVNGNYEGFFEGADCGSLRGWVYNRNAPNAPVIYEILANGTVVTSATASNFRQDLKNAGKGNGEHGFSLETPASLKTGQNVSVNVRVKDTGYLLKNGPRTVNCPAPGGTTNPPGGTPTTPPSGTVTGNFDGYFEGADCGNFGGWVWDKNQPNAVVTVSILANNVVIGTVAAGNFRQDLKNAGKGNGQHGFSFTPPASIKNGQPQSIAIKVKDSSYQLRNSPKTVTCAPAARLGAGGSGPQEFSVLVWPNPTDGRLRIRLHIPEREPAELGVWDSAGRRLWSRSVTGAGREHEEVVTLPASATGVVAVTATVGKQRFSKKIIVNR